MMIDGTLKHTRNCNSKCHCYSAFFLFYTTSPLSPPPTHSLTPSFSKQFERKKWFNRKFVFCIDFHWFDIAYEWYCMFTAHAYHSFGIEMEKSQCITAKTALIWHKRLGYRTHFAQKICKQIQLPACVRNFRWEIRLLIGQYSSDRISAYHCVFKCDSLQHRCPPFDLNFVLQLFTKRKLGVGLSNRKRF